jgi:hypothetical protein
MEDNRTNTPPAVQPDLYADFSPTALAYKASMRQWIEDHLEIYMKGANYLLVAHGAGIAGCLTALKDYTANNPSLRGIGLVFAAFVVGFLLASSGYFYACFGRAVWLRSVGKFSGDSEEPFLRKSVFLLCASSFFLSMILIVLSCRFLFY